MGRLIDADALIEEIKNKMPVGATRGVFRAFIDDAPTAYDVEKVVAELEEKDDDCGCGKIDVWTAIEIVRNGGVK